MPKPLNSLIVGGTGFMGPHVVRLFVQKHPEYQIFNIKPLPACGDYKNEGRG